MDISVERRLYVTLNGTPFVLTEGEAITLARALVDGLVIQPHDLDMLTTPATVTSTATPTPALSPGPSSETGTYVNEDGLKYGNWSADEPELRRLYAEGLTVKEIAARLHRPIPATQGKLHNLGLRRDKASQPTPLRPPEPESVPRTCTGWTREQTHALIQEMRPGAGGIRAAAEKTGHTMGSCALRWKHLKAAGTMTLETYNSSPEAVPA